MVINNLMKSASSNVEVIENNVSKTEIWDCLNCGACVNECPVGI